LFAPSIYIVVLRAHPVRGESHIQRNATAEVAKLDIADNCPSKTKDLWPNNITKKRKTAFTVDKQLQDACEKQLQGYH